MVHVVGCTHVLPSREENNSYTSCYGVAFLYGFVFGRLAEETVRGSCGTIRSPDYPTTFCYFLLVRSPFPSRGFPLEYGCLLFISRPRLDSSCDQCSHLSRGWHQTNERAGRSLHRGGIEYTSMPTHTRIRIPPVRIGPLVLFVDFYSTSRLVFPSMFFQNIPKKLPLN